MSTTIILSDFFYENIHNQAPTPKDYGGLPLMVHRIHISHINSVCIWAEIGSS